MRAIFIDNMLNAIMDTEQVDGLHDESLKRSQKTLTYVMSLNDKDIPNRKDIIANLYSCIGNAHLEMGNFKKALENHNKDLDLANEK